MAEQSNTEPQNTSSPGLILRAAREELSYTVDQVADALHLRSSVVIALEEEEYGEFSSDVFLKGYFRSYCRLVNLHEARMIELLEEQLKQQKKQQRSVEKVAKKAAKTRRNKKAVTLIGVAIVIAIIIILLGQMQSDVESAVSTDTSNEKQDKVEQPDTGVLQAQPEETALQPESNNVSGVIDNDKPDPEKAENNDLQEADPNPAIEIVQESQESGLSAQSPQLNESYSEQQPIEPLVSNVITATFSGDCWVTVKNSEGKTVIAALKTSGQSISYQGAAGPYKIVLGNARVANLYFNDEAVDLTPFTRRNGRAEFTLGES